MQKIVFLLLLSTFALNANAYLDPGTGSLVLQGLIAGIAVAWLTIKTYWYKISSFLGRKAPRSLLDDEEPVADSDS